MARVLCIDDYMLYAEMVGLLLQRKGQHEVKVEIVPFRLQDIEEFAPDVLLINLVRKMEALRSPLADFYAEVDGARAFRAVAASPSLRTYPVVLTAIALEEREVPRDLSYLAFVSVPGELDRLTEVIDRVASNRGEGMAPD